MDDVTLSEDLVTIEKDITTIIESFPDTSKCELIMELIFTPAEGLATLKDFVRVNKEDTTLLGAPVHKGKAQDAAIQKKIDDLSTAIDRLAHLHSHDALAILKNSLATPKLLYLLRTSECADNPLLSQFDNTLRAGSHHNFECGLEGRSTDTSLATCPRWRFGHTECSDAGTFSLLGIGCIYTPAPTVHLA